MNFEEVMSFVTGLLQFIVAGYALRLNRIFGTARVGWSLFWAFLLLALLHFIQSVTSFNNGALMGAEIEVVYALISLLLLTGMVHIETLLRERLQAEAYDGVPVKCGCGSLAAGCNPERWDRQDGGGLRLSDIAERLGMSLNATKYHVENMMDAGLLEISNTRYSVKGRKVKIYRMKNQIFIVAPGMTEKKQIISAVMKYGSFLGIYILIALGLVVLIPLPELAGSIPLAGSILPAGTEAVADQGFVAALLIAAVITLLLLVGYEVREYFRNRQTAGD